jgi:hypothetical protein
LGFELVSALVEQWEIDAVVEWAVMKAFLQAVRMAFEEVGAMDAWTVDE